MFTQLHLFRDISLISIFLRMLFAVVCGSIIGIEREFKRRPAGFRTHILICLGASMTMITSQYLLQETHYYIDVARLSAQVVAGVGLICAGTIIVTRRQRVKGLTTAAGLWTTAIIGLALGAGFFEGGIFATALILVAEIFFSKYEFWLLRQSPEINVYVRYEGRQCLEQSLKVFRDWNIRVLNLEITRSEDTENQKAVAFFALKIQKKTPMEQVMAELAAIEGLEIAEEL